MAFLEIFGSVGIVLFGVMTTLWLASLFLHDASIVDVFWGAGFVISTWTAFSLAPGGSVTRTWLLNGLVTVWGVRLSFHILVRNWGRGEDFRYRRWRQEHGDHWWWRSYFQVFLLQGALMWVISTPLLFVQINAEPASLTVFDVVAVAVWAIGFFFEAVGDWQLARFKADPANEGRVLDAGLWRYTRHPNYFGDAVQWWAYYLFVLPAGGWWTIVSPVLMTFLLLRISGVALLEKDLQKTKPQYEEYVERTNAFIPWFPRE